MPARRSRGETNALSKVLTAAQTIVSWTFGILFIVIGLLNAFLVHIVPGIFYLLLSFVYFPPAIALVRKRLGFSIPFAIRIILGLVILWGTLAVGDLAEMFGL